MDAVLTESRILQALDHPAIPQIIGFIPSVPELSIVMTLMPGKPLHDFIHPLPQTSLSSPSGVPLPLPDVLRIALCLADVLECVHASHEVELLLRSTFNVPGRYVHGAGVVHRDLKPANVLQVTCDV
jgi:serine/threonine protein kinase